MKMSETRFLVNCPKCGYIAQAWTEGGVRVQVSCQMCGYHGTLPNPDLKDKPWRVG
jgi:Zn ribbon nucleic-acid-binding protein